MEDKRLKLEGLCCKNDDFFELDGVEVTLEAAGFGLLFSDEEEAVLEVAVVAKSLECIALLAGGDRAKLRVLVCNKTTNYSLSLTYLSIHSLWSVGLFSFYIVAVSKISEELGSTRTKLLGTNTGEVMKN